jgi:hypothetical protein
MREITNAHAFNQQVIKRGVISYTGVERADGEAVHPTLCLPPAIGKIER